MPLRFVNVALGVGLQPPSVENRSARPQGKQLGATPRSAAPRSPAQVTHWGLASPSFSTSAFSRTKVSCANFLYADVLMYMGTMS